MDGADEGFMRGALALARRGIGRAWPNPAVGCVLVQQGRVVGRAVTAAGGRPHAETEALAMAGPAARGATAYVTLEPCAHHGHTPPCADALVGAGIVRAVIGARDPDPRVNGAGIARLRAGGVDVHEGVLGEACAELNAGFFSCIRSGRPLVTLKLASTLDGRIATGAGESRWITGEEARRSAHLLRGRHDAVLVGAGTVAADDPDLTCRLTGFRAVQLVRVVADSHLRTPLTARLVRSARRTPTWILCRNGADEARRGALAECGVVVIDIPAAGVGIDLDRAREARAARGITRLLAEGGARIAASLLRADRVDRIAWFHAPTVIGGDGWPAAEAFGVETLARMPRFVRASARPVGADWLTELRRAA